MSGDGEAASDGPQTLKTVDAHNSGHVAVAWTTAEGGGLAALTAGTDGKVVRRQIRPNHQDLNNVKVTENSIHCLAVHPDGALAAITEGQHVKTLKLPELQLNKLPVTRFTTHSRCCCWSKDGQYMAAGADDGTIKLVTVKEQNKVKCVLRSEGYVRGLALDPEATFVAAANADGHVLVWRLDSSGNTQEFKKRIGPKLDHEDGNALQGLAWHPDGGALLAVAGPDNDVILLERLSWQPTNYLAGGHSGSVKIVAFSPNGVYAATAGTDCKLVIWDVEKAVQVSVRQLSSTASSLQWHQQANMLLFGSVSGGYGIWANPVPEKESNLPSPWKPIDEIEKEKDIAVAAAAAASTGGGSRLDDEDDDLMDDSIADGAVIKRRGLRHTAAAADSMATGADGPNGLDDVFEELDAAIQEAEEAAARGAGPGGPAGFLSGRPGPQAVRMMAAPKPKKPQRPIQPGSTPDDSSSGSEDGGGGGVGARFLAYNPLGCVVSKAVDDHHVIEVTFHDTAKHRLRVPRLTDFYGFTAASLGPRGVAYISPAAGEEQPSILMYRCFESWATDTEWTVALPAGEDALVVAAGSSCVAVATSEQLLRLYSLAGRQLAVLNLQGPVVAVVAAGPIDAGAAGLSVSHQHQLAVVWANGPAEPLNNTQQLSYQVFDVSRCCQCYSGRVALSAGASLTWLNFSREGLLATMDSAGTLRVRSPDWGGAWVPVLDAAAAKERCGAERLWPAWLDCNNLTAVVTHPKAPYPQVLPRPLITPIPLGLPVAPSDAAAAAGLEEQALRSGLVSAQLRKAAEDITEDAASVAEELEAAQTESDRSALRLMNEYMKANKPSRALELVGTLQNTKYIEGAKKLAVGNKLTVLAERIQVFLEKRLEWEEEQAAAAAAQQVQEGLHGGWGAGAVAGGMEDDMQVLPDQADQCSQPTAAAAAPAVSAAAKPAPICGVAAASKGAGTLKRKPVPADLGLGKAGSGNPFARKKTK